MPVAIGLGSLSDVDPTQDPVSGLERLYSAARIRILAGLTLSIGISMPIYRILPLISMIALLSACGGLKIKPPESDQSTLLILPVNLKHTAERRRYGFSFAYEIVSSDNSIEPYRAVFKLPVAGDMLIVDSLPPGDYRVSKLITIPVGTGTRHFSGIPQRRNDGFTLNAGQITMFSQALNVSVYNKIPGRGQSTTYAKEMRPLSTAQLLRLRQRLAGLPNFQHWNLADDKGLVLAGIQGEWNLGWEPTRKFVLSNATTCYPMKTRIRIDGASLQGEGSTPQLGDFELIGLVSKPGTIKGNILQDDEEIAAFWGRVDEKLLKGKYVDANQCRGVWHFRPASTAVDAEPAVSPDEIDLSGIAEPQPVVVEPVVISSPASSVKSDIDVSGRYRSRITSNSHYIFKRRYRDVEITLVQQGKRVTGADDSGILKITGVLEGDRIQYEVEPGIATGNYHVSGEWRVDPDQGLLQGSWMDSRGDGPGDWDLRRDD